MATNQQRREAAKRKLDRQLTRQAERAKRRKIVGTGVTIGAVLVAAGLVVFIVTRGDPSTAGQASEQKTSSTAKSSANKTTSGPCQYESSPRGSAGKDVGLPSDPKQTPDSGRVDAALHTNLGTLDITLDRSKAPCTVQSMVHLIESGFYEDSPCHRLTTREKLNVLQCGDPTGTGKGGPGYTIPDEPPENLESTENGKAVVYPRGTVAMAKSAQPDSGGSQFFIVHEDTTLAPQYTVFGTVDEEDMDIVDKVVEAGVDGGGKDGAPAKSVKIKTAELA